MQMNRSRSGCRMPHNTNVFRCNSYSSHSTSSSKKVESAKSKDATIAGKYKTTGNLYLRVGAGTGKTAITLMPKGSDVQKPVRLPYAT